MPPEAGGNLAVHGWQYLVKDGADGLPLKQRIPEVALFRGETLEACFHSSTRGLLQRRVGSEATCEALVDRLLGARAAAAAATGGGELALTRNTPVAILRYAPAPGAQESQGAASSATTAQPPRSRVVPASELMDVLDTRTGASAAAESNDGMTVVRRPYGVGPEDVWSIQGIVQPAKGLRHMAIYEREASGAERLEVVGRSFEASYPAVLSATGAADNSAAADGAEASAEGFAVPQEQAQAIEAKTLALVRYLQRFHQLFVERLVAEFVIDASSRKVFTGFEVVLTFDPSTAPPLPAQEGDEVAAGASHGSSVVFAGTASAMSTDLGSAGPSRPTSAKSASYYDYSGGLSRSVSGTGGGGRRPSVDEVLQGASRSSRPTSATGGGGAGGGGGLDPLLSQSVHIDEDVAEEGDDLDELIERARAAAKPKAKPRRRSRPVRRPEGRAGDAQAAAAAAAQRRPMSARAAARPPPPRDEVAGGAGAALRPRRRPESAQARCFSGGGGGGVAAAVMRSQASPSPPPAPTPPSAPSGQQGHSFNAPKRPASARASPAVAAARQHQQQQQEDVTGAGRTASCERTARPRSNSVGDLRRSRARSGSPTGRATSSTAQVHSRQLFSRYDKESEARPRMTSVLARQLERLRECTPYWAAQQEALAVVMWKQSQYSSTIGAEVEKLYTERETIEATYTKRYEDLVRGLQREQVKAKAAVEEKRKALEKSHQEERQTTKVLNDEEVKSRALKCTLEQTVAQLDAVKSEMLQCQAAAEARGLAVIGGEAPRLRAQQQKIDEGMRQKRFLQQESAATAQEIETVREELRTQRAYSGQLEAFVRRLASAGSNSGRYAIDTATKREINRLLALTQKRSPLLEDACMAEDPEQEQQPPPPPPLQQQQQQQQPLAPAEPVAGAGALYGWGAGMVNAAAPAPSAASRLATPGAGHGAGPARQMAAPPPATEAWGLGGGGSGSFSARAPPGFEAARRAAEEAVFSGGLLPGRGGASAAGAGRPVAAAN